MGTETVDAAVQECDTRSWEPVAELDDLPDWELQVEILSSQEDSETGTKKMP